MILKFAGVLILAKMIGHSLSYVLGVGVTALVMLVFIVPFLRVKVSGHSDRRVVGNLLIFGWPFVFHILSGNILSYFSRFFLEAYNSIKDVGIFTFAFTFGSALYVAYAGLSTYFEPRIYSHADDKPHCERWLAYFISASILIASVGGAILLIIFPYLMPYLSADYGQALPIISMVMGTVLLQPLYLQGNYRLTVYKRTGYIAAVTFLASSLSIILYFLMIPSYGIWGAAMALYLSNFFLSACMLGISIRIARISVRQLYSKPIYLICALGSLLVIVSAYKPVYSILALLVICLASMGFLTKMYLVRGEEKV